MKIDAYSIVYSGLNPEPCYAAATSDETFLWAAASGTGKGAALKAVQSLETLNQKSALLTSADVEAEFQKINPVLQRNGFAVSVAGAFCSSEGLQMFNIGNARAFLFSNGYMTHHTEDHTEAYAAYREMGPGNAANYDNMRTQKSHLTLLKALGLNEEPKAQFYPCVPLEKDTALLVCTECFWRYLNVIEMEVDYRKSAGPEEWLKIMSRRVLMKANKKLDDENFAAVAAMVEE